MTDLVSATHGTDAQQTASARMAGAAGLLAVGLYVGTTVVGAAMSPGYSHVADPISELTSSSAPHAAGLAVGYVGYNLATAVFAYGLRRATVTSPRTGYALPWMVVGAIAGIGEVTLFRQDSIGEAATAAGRVHVGLAGVSALLTVVCAVLYAIAFGKDVGWDRTARFTWTCVLAILLTGPVAAAGVGRPWMGLAERLPIGAFLLWIAVVSVRCVRAARGISTLTRAAQAAAR
jgi:Protein of unknown function (DUF998)